MRLLIWLACVQGLYSHDLISGVSWWTFLVPLILPQVASWLLLPWLATVWIYPLEVREGHGGWNIAYKKQKRAKRIVRPRAPQGPSWFYSWLIFHFSLSSFFPPWHNESSRCFVISLIYLCVRVVCNFLTSVSLQQRFEMVDQCYSSFTAQFY